MILGRLIGRRLLGAVVTLWLVSLFIFGAVELMPGAAAEAMLGKDATPEAVQTLRKELHLAQPAAQRYVGWLGSVAAGDPGKSIVTGQRIAPVLRERLGNTLFLALWAAVVACPIA